MPLPLGIAIIEKRVCLKLELNKYGINVAACLIDVSGNGAFAIWMGSMGYLDAK